MDLARIDPATLMPSAELNALVAEWMGWRSIKQDGRYWITDLGGLCRKSHWSPSTDPAHAGEARREAYKWKLDSRHGEITCRIQLIPKDDWYTGTATFAETDSKAEAEALATSRAFAAMLKARERRE